MWLRSAIRVLQLLGETVLDARRPAGDEVSFGKLACRMRLSAHQALEGPGSTRLPAGRRRGGGSKVRPSLKACCRL